MKKTKKSYEVAAWTAMSKYIRERDGWICYTCGKKAYGRSMHAGHLFPRTKKILKFDYRNVKAQCAACNKFNEGETAVYINRFIREFGMKLYDFFYTIRNRTKIRSVEDFIKIKKYYKLKLAELMLKRKKQN